MLLIIKILIGLILLIGWFIIGTDEGCYVDEGGFLRTGKDKKIIFKQDIKYH